MGEYMCNWGFYCCFWYWIGYYNYRVVVKYLILLLFLSLIIWFFWLLLEVNVGCYDIWWFYFECLIWLNEIEMENFKVKYLVSNCKR